jgi:hypothetical protein
MISPAATLAVQFLFSPENHKGEYPMSQTATGTTTRIQMQREGQSIIPHANLLTYDPNTGAFTALFDFQKPGDAPYSFDPLSTQPGKFSDQDGLVWTLIR